MIGTLEKGLACMHACMHVATINHRRGCENLMKIVQSEVYIQAQDVTDFLTNSTYTDLFPPRQTT